MSDKELDFETRAAQAGTRVRVGDTISTFPPIDPSSSFTAESIDEVHEALKPEPKGFAYSRNANPTGSLLEAAIADLEGAEEALVFASGMAAITNVLTALMLEEGDAVVASKHLYGITRSAFLQLANRGVEIRYVDIDDLDEVDEAASRPGARFLYFETIGNPLLQVADVERLAEIGHRHHLTVVNDNTFATPYLFRPLDAGVDISLMSGTKYLSGHGDVSLGVAAGTRSRMRPLRDARIVSGGILSPFEAWLALRGLRTLPLRLERQCGTASEVAGWLAGQDWVRRVYYPGLDDSPYRSIAAGQFGGRFGAMIGFEVMGDRRGALSFIDALDVITPATTLGDVISLVLYPPLASHRNLPAEELNRLGIGQGLVRLSIGLESPRDLIRDLQQATDRSGIRGMAEPAAAQSV